MVFLPTGYSPITFFEQPHGSSANYFRFGKAPLGTQNNIINASSSEIFNITMLKQSGTLKGTLFVGLEAYPVLSASDIGLELAGKIRLRDFNNRSTVGGNIYGQNGEIYVSDRNGQSTLLSSHFDPRRVEPTAKTSFADTKVSIPYSIHHKNPLIGKGSVIDITKMVEFVEKMMIEELGEDNGKLVYDYNLNKEEMISKEQIELEAVLAVLSATPPIKVELDSNGSVPSEAFEVIDEVVSVSETRLVDEKVLDIEQERVITKKLEITEEKNVQTGRKIKKLKDGWVFENGELYRPATVDDLDLKTIIDQCKLPEWVMIRMTENKNKPISQLIDEIRKLSIVEEKTQAGIYSEK